MAQFVQIPNETVRDDRLSYLARGLLGEALSHSAAWRHEGAEETHRRTRAARGDKAEGLRVIRAAYAELERYGYRHVLRWQDRPGGKLLNQLVYYPSPALCGDPRCASCRKRADQEERGISAGQSRRSGSGTSGLTREDVEFSQVVPALAVPGGSGTARATEDRTTEHRTEDEDPGPPEVSDHAPHAPHDRLSCSAEHDREQIAQRIIDDRTATRAEAIAIRQLVLFEALSRPHAERLLRQARKRRREGCAHRRAATEAVSSVTLCLDCWRRLPYGEPDTSGNQARIATTSEQRSRSNEAGR